MRNDDARGETESRMRMLASKPGGGQWTGNHDEYSPAVTHLENHNANFMAWWYWSKPAASANKLTLATALA